MLVLSLSVCQCAPKQWQNSHLEDISIQSLQFVTSAKTAQWFLWRHIVLHLLIKLCPIKMLSRTRAPAPYTINWHWSRGWVKNTIAEQRGNWQHIDREGYCWYETRSHDPQLLNCVIFKEIQTINTALWLINVSWQITVLPQFKHVNRSSFHIYLKHEINMNKHQKVFYFNRGTHNFSSSSPPKLICSSKARRDTAAVTGHAHLQSFPSRQYNVKPIKMVLKST